MTPFRIRESLCCLRHGRLRSDRRLIRLLVRIAERQTRDSDKQPNQTLDTPRLSEPFGGPNDSHGASELTQEERLDG